MRTVNMHEAMTQLSKLIEAVAALARKSSRGLPRCQLSGSAGGRAAWAHWQANALDDDAPLPEDVLRAFEGVGNCHQVESGSDRLHR